MSGSQLELPLWMKSYVKPKVIVPKSAKISEKTSSETTKSCETADVITYHHFWQIAEFSEKLLLKADKEDIFVIGLDLDWPSTYKSVLTKTSKIHICYGKNKCCFLMVGNIKVLPKSLTLLISHSNVKLSGYNLSEDITKLGRDFNYDIKAVLNKINLAEVFPDQVLYCCHNWDYDSATERFKCQEVEPVASPFCSISEPFRFTGKLKYSNHLSTCGAAAEELLELASNYSVDRRLILGFDLEWPFSRGSGSGKVALAQICADKHTCYLFHIPKLNSLPKTFVLLLNHKNVRLVGVNIANDIRKIGRDFNIETQYILENNICELGPLANKILNIFDRWSLARLTLRLLGKELDKTPLVRCSNWAQDNLSDKQLMYAASDAYAGLAIYKHLMSIKEKSAQGLSFEV